MQHDWSRTALMAPALALLLAMAAACGPTIEDPEQSGSGSGSGSGSASGSASGESADGESADGESGVPASGCGIGDDALFGGGPPGPLGFPPGCNPSVDPGVNGYRCCSDDPAAVGSALPDYQGRNIPSADQPYFSGANNDLSDSGQCIRVGDIAGQGLQEAAAMDCPIPCNPTWPSASINSVCGQARVCCQTTPLGPGDCVQDASTGLWRPVNGDDIGELTQWRPSDHETHQDPNGTSCLSLAGGDASSSNFQDCVRQLSVADQRGFCMALGAGQLCPAEDPAYVDACEMLNGG